MNTFQDQQNAESIRRCQHQCSYEVCVLHTGVIRTVGQQGRFPGPIILQILEMERR